MLQTNLPTLKRNSIPVDEVEKWLQENPAEELQKRKVENLKIDIIRRLKLGHFIALSDYQKQFSKSVIIDAVWRIRQEQKEYVFTISHGNQLIGWFVVK